MNVRSRAALGASPWRTRESRGFTGQDVPRWRGLANQVRAGAGLVFAATEMVDGSLG